MPSNSGPVMEDCGVWPIKDAIHKNDVTINNGSVRKYGIVC